MNEDGTLWLIIHSHQYEGYNGREWSYEDTENTADRGYFTSWADAQAWIDAEKQRLIAQGRAKNDAELASKNADAEQRHETRTAQDEVRRREYDALVEAGIAPSFARPDKRAPFKAQTSKFDEQIYLKGLGLDWEIVEIEPHQQSET